MPPPSLSPSPPLVIQLRHPPSILRLWLRHGEQARDAGSVAAFVIAQSSARRRTSNGSNLPSFAIMMLDVLAGFRAIAGAHLLGVPFELFADAIGDVAQQRGLGQRAGIIKLAGRGAAGFNRFNPFVVMA